MTYSNRVVFETACEGLGDGLLVLLLDDAGGGSEYTKCCLAFSGVWCDTELEENSEQIRPGLICTCVSRQAEGGGRKGKI